MGLFFLGVFLGRCRRRRADDFLFFSTSHDQKIVVHDFSVGLNTSLFV